MKKVKNILLVDDDAITNHINKLLIKTINLTESIHTAQNGEEALLFLKQNCQGESYQDECPALVFLDLNMPIMDGFEFLENFVHQTDFDVADIPVFVLTSSENSKDIEKANLYKISGYISKPLTPQKVNDVVAQLKNE